MAEKDQGDKKPFYANIVDRKTRVRKEKDGDGRPGGSRARNARAGEKAEGRVPRAGERDRPRDGSAPRDRNDRRDGADRGLRADRPSRDGFARGDRPVHSGFGPRAGSVSRGPSEDRSTQREGASQQAPVRHPRKPFVGPNELVPVFGALTKETRALLESFPEIVQGVFPLDSKKIQQLPAQIRELSHYLTDERGERRVGYMNEPATVSAYVHYYMWWNLVRLTSLFSSLPLELGDGDTAVDLGSGPLTLPIALWMARPDLRKKRISWYCVDISQGALSAGEELFLSLAAKTGDEPWQITRVKGECGVSLKRRVRLVACANMFNELYWDSDQPLEALAKQYARDISSYAEADSSILVVEPGIPRAGRFVSLLRDSLMRLDFHPVAPCPHEGACPFPGLRNGKWCHFVLDTSGAPAKLHRLSDDAGLVKDRAALSFIFALRKKSVDGADVAETPSAGQVAPIASGAASRKSTEIISELSKLFTGLTVRITSDPIRLPDFHLGRYGCSELGMVMVTGTYAAADYLKTCASGSLIEVPMPDRKRPERDEKTGAIVIRL